MGLYGTISYFENTEIIKEFLGPKTISGFQVSAEIQPEFTLLPEKANSYTEAETDDKWIIWINSVCIIPGGGGAERELVIDNLLVRIHFIIVMIRWTGLAPWEFEFPLPGSLTSTFL